MKPLTRKEMLLDEAAKGNLDTFKPATREEVFAKRALANAGGSGGGSVLHIYWGKHAYVYKDAGETEKVTREEIKAVVDGGGVIWATGTFYLDGENYSNITFLVTFVNFPEDEDYADLIIAVPGGDMDTRYTAEYVAPSLD